MLSLKNSFAKSTPAPSPAGSSMPAVNDPNNVVKRWQLEQGRTRKRVEDLTGQLDAERLARDEAHHAVGECVTNGADTTEAEVALQRIEGRVRTLDAAVTVAIEKDHHAQTQLANARREASIEAEAEACADLLTLAPEWEAFLKEASRLAHATTAAANTLRVRRGNERFGFALAEIRGQADLFLGLSMSSLTGTGFLPERLRKFRSMSECLESVCGLRPRDEPR